MLQIFTTMQNLYFKNESLRGVVAHSFNPSTVVNSASSRTVRTAQRHGLKNKQKKCHAKTIIEELDAALQYIKFRCLY